MTPGAGARAASWPSWGSGCAAERSWSGEEDSVVDVGEKARRWADPDGVEVDVATESEREGGAKAVVDGGARRRADRSCAEAGAASVGGNTARSWMYAPGRSDTKKEGDLFPEEWNCKRVKKKKERVSGSPERGDQERPA